MKKYKPFLIAILVLHILIFFNLFLVLGERGMIFFKILIGYASIILLVGGMEWWLRTRLSKAKTKSDLVKIPIKLSFLLWLVSLIPCVAYLVVSENSWGWFLVLFLPFSLGLLGLAYSVGRVILGKIIRVVSPKLLEKGIGVLLARMLPLFIGIWILNLGLLLMAGYLVWIGF